MRPRLCELRCAVFRIGTRQTLEDCSSIRYVLCIFKMQSVAARSDVSRSETDTH